MKLFHAPHRTHRAKILLLILSIAISPLMLTQTTSAKDVNNFYFKSFDADYYVTKDANGVSHMHVKETLVGVFPGYNQNLGIIRNIPYSNQDGANITVPSKGALNLKVSRNHRSEPIYSIDKEDGYYMVATGDDVTYLHGEQEFIFEYDFEKVITDFSDYQELYWDTNGNGWSQRFDELTARVHFEDSSVLLDQAPSCYVGYYGAKGEDRCTITEIADGFEFHAAELKPRENLTYSIEIQPKSFSTPVTYNYSAVIFLVAVLAFAGVIGYFIYKYTDALKAKRQHYKGLFVAPEYQPFKDLTPPEVAAIAITTTREPRVAALIDLAVQGKIQLIKGEKSLLGKQKWSIKVVDISNIPKEESIILSILNNGERPENGETFEVKSRSSNSKLISLSASFETHVKSALRRKHFLEPKKLENRKDFLALPETDPHRIAVKYSGRLGFISAAGFCGSFFLFPILITFFEEEISGVLLGGTPLILTSIGIFIAAVITAFVVLSVYSKYQDRTMEGLTMARRIEGLELYMKMAEKDRINFLQSVDGADTSPEGIVKLYEKLLPYAILFGLETTWLAQLEHCYQTMPARDGYDTYMPMWYYGAAFRASDFHSFSTTTAASISRSTMSSSGGSSSSGFSGGGGGGFSGGGGGGGGGGGR